jgi:hypothetical protein
LDIAVVAGYTDPYFVAAVSGAWLHLELEKLYEEGSFISFALRGLCVCAHQGGRQRDFGTTHSITELGFASNALRSRLFAWLNLASLEAEKGPTVTGVAGVAKEQTRSFGFARKRKVIRQV